MQRPKPPTPAAVLETLVEHIAQEEADHGLSDEATSIWARRVRADMMSRIAELRRRMLPAAPTARRVSPIAPDVLALDREGLLARLASFSQGERVQYAHRDLTGLSDDDLRRMLTLSVVRTQE
jgi:hypothetical protein